MNIVLYTRDMEPITLIDLPLWALKLQPSWLPGQRAKINEYERSVRNLSEVLLATLSRGMGGH